jgi:hypothetical protein
MWFWRRDREAPEAAYPPVAESSPTDLREALKEAYELGRREERARHRGHPLVALVVFLVALVGAGMMYLAAREGSFSRGGQVVDQKLASAARQAGAAGQGAATAVSGAGANLQQQSVRR